MSEILVGSKYFFSGYDDFQPKDTDMVEIVETNEFQWMRLIRGQGRCLLQFNKKLTKEQHIERALATEAGLVIGKFLVPEFCQKIGFGVQDLLKLLPLVEKLDNRHKYEKIIFDSYIKNNSFSLTDEQREAAYKAYLEERCEEWSI